MADSQGLSPGDTGYDPFSDPYSAQYGQPSQSGSPTAGGGGMTPTVGGGSFAPVAGQAGMSYATPVGQLAGGISGLIGSGAAAGAHGSDADLLSYLLSQNSGDPQGAIDRFNQLKPGSALAPKYYADRNVIGWAGQALPYLTAPGTTTGQTTWNPGGVPGGDSGGASSFRIDPSYLAPFTEQFTAPGDPNNPASAAFAANPKAFTLPTESDLFSSPGFQGAQDAARNAVVNANASKGLINSGGSIYDLANVSAGLEGQQYNDLVNNRANAYGINLGAGQQSFNDAWQQYLNRQNVFYGNQTNPFNKLSTLASLGMNAASNAG